MDACLRPLLPAPALLEGAEVWRAVRPVAAGSLAGCLAAVCVQPLDTVKVRVQIGGAEGGCTSPVKVAGRVLREDGPRGLYKGLTAAFTRECTYTGARLGLYDILAERASAGAPPGERLPLWKTTVIALGVGGVAAVLGNPADLALIRMQADTMLPVAARRNYRGVGHAFASIVREEGFRGLLKGAVPTATRSMALNLGMFGSNTLAKDALVDLGAREGGAAQVCGAAAIAGFFASVLSLPFDHVRTQVQNMRPDPVTGRMPYAGPLDCAMQQVRKGGVRQLWTGFPTFYLRIAPDTMLTLMAQDFLKKQWASLGV